MKKCPRTLDKVPGDHLLCRYSVLKNGRNLPECVQIIHKGVIMSGTIFSLIPPIVAIALALITKEVYLSLLIGIMSGAFLFTGPNPLHAVETMIAIMGEKIGGNVNILLFLAFLGIVVALITKSGASKAYGEWASHAIRTKKGALFATMFLGMLIFVDDYFNLPDRRHGYASGDGQAQDHTCEVSLHHRCDGGADLYHRADLKLGGSGRFFASGGQRGGRLQSVPSHDSV